MSNEQNNYIQEFLKVVHRHGIFEEVFWSVEPQIKFSVLCDDVLSDMADHEPVETLEDVENLDRACRDADNWGGWLYCARRRGVRPRYRWYGCFSEKEKELFNQCGPQGEKDE